MADINIYRFKKIQSLGRAKFYRTIDQIARTPRIGGATIRAWQSALAERFMPLLSNIHLIQKTGRLARR